HAAREALGRNTDVPLDAAVAEVVDTGHRGQLLEAELVAQRERDVQPLAVRHLEGDLVAEAGNDDAGGREALAQAVGERLAVLVHPRTPWRSGPKLVPRRIFCCSCRMP